MWMNFQARIMKPVTSDVHEEKFKEYEKGIYVNEFDDQHKAEVKEFNDWHCENLEERKYSKVGNKTTRRL